MARLFGLQIEPSAESAFQHDYWEEFSKVNDTFSHDPDLNVVRVSKNKTAPKKSPSDDDAAPLSKGQRFRNFFKTKTDAAKGIFKSKSDEVAVVEELRSNNSPTKSLEKQDEQMYPSLQEDTGQNDTREREQIELVSVAIQTDMSYMRDIEQILPYSCCFCCRSSTPCIVWAFVGISLLFFKMGAIVTGRWIYLSQTNFDEIVFYITFTVCLGFATFYFRHGTKHHNPFDLMFLVLTVPIMWGLLTFTTFFVKENRDAFFLAGSIIYSIFVLPYISIGVYIAYRFWTSGKLFFRRVDGIRALEPLCRKLFFATSLMIFDGQISICAGIISMSSKVNNDNVHVWISSLVFGPISMVITGLWMIIGYFAMRTESKLLTWIFTLLSANQILLIIGMLLKRPSAAGGEFIFVNAAMVFCAAAVLTVHICLLVILWNWVVPSYGKGLKIVVRQTSRNNCIQCAQLTICR